MTLSYSKYNVQLYLLIQIVSEYDQEIPHSQTGDNRMAPRGRGTWTLHTMLLMGGITLFFLHFFLLQYIQSSSIFFS